MWVQKYGLLHILPFDKHMQPDISNMDTIKKKMFYGFRF